MRAMLLEGKVAIVTGAGSGIGRASALRFAEEGAAVVVADIRGPKCDETVAMIAEAGGTAATCQVDVADHDSVAAMVAFAVERFGGLDALFNNAGTIRPGSAVNLSVEDWDLVMAVNVRSVFLGAKHAVPAMAERGGGTIVSTASVSGMAGDGASVVYGASKAAVINLTRCLAVDHAKQGIRVNCICPGAIETPPIGRMLADPAARDGHGAQPPARPDRSAGARSPPRPCGCAATSRRSSPVRRSSSTAGSRPGPTSARSATLVERSADADPSGGLAGARAAGCGGSRASCGPKRWEHAGLGVGGCGFGYQMRWAMSCHRLRKAAAAGLDGA